MRPAVAARAPCHPAPTPPGCAAAAERREVPAGGAMTTPARAQYLAMKAQHPDAVLWFRMGDFYELFDDDAQLVARELHLTLTSREFGRGERVPMAGVPYHAAESYLARLVRKGYRVAIAEQVSPPGHGLVERVVTRVVTAGAAGGAHPPPPP